MKLHAITSPDGSPAYPKVRRRDATRRGLPPYARAHYARARKAVNRSWGCQAGVLEHWGKLTDDEIDKIAGKRDQLEGKIQEHYGLDKDAAKKHVDDWMKTQK